MARLALIVAIVLTQMQCVTACVSFDTLPPCHRHAQGSCAHHADDATAPMVAQVHADFVPAGVIVIADAATEVEANAPRAFAPSPPGPEISSVVLRI